MAEQKEIHLCTGLSCWTCGEPEQLRDMRNSIAKAFFNNSELGLRLSESMKLARYAAQAIREDVISMMAAYSQALGQLHFSNLAAETLRDELDNLEEHHRTADVEE